MFSSVHRLKLALLAAAVGLTAVYAQAQGDGASAKDFSSSPIIFSSPQNDVSTNTPSFVPQTANRSLLNAPAPQIFNPETPRIILPPMQQQSRPRTTVQSATDWTLKTPAEILGVETPDDAFKSPEQKAYDKQRDGQTVLERFLRRQTDACTGITNEPAANQGLRWDFSNDKETVRDSIYKNPNQLLENAQDNSANFLRNALDEWSGSRNAARNFSFDRRKEMPSAPVSPQEVTATKQFENLLAPSTKSASTSASQPLVPIMQDDLPSPQPVVDPDLQLQPLFSPVGSSYRPLESNISKPVGIQPLPTLVSTQAPPPVATPSWAPKPPPWLSEKPQPFAIPERKF